MVEYRGEQQGDEEDVVLEIVFIKDDLEVSDLYLLLILYMIAAKSNDGLHYFGRFADFFLTTDS